MTICVAIIKKGVNAGKQCTHDAEENTELCTRHTPKPPKPDGPLCKALIKNGENAGKPCPARARENEEFCGRHAPRTPKADGEKKTDKKVTKKTDKKVEKKDAPKKDGPLCKALIKNGENAGKPCKTVAKEGSEFCGRHAPRTPKTDGEKKTEKKAPKKDGPLCKALIKNGENAGKPCTTLAKEGLEFCGRHAPRAPKPESEKKVETVEKKEVAKK